MNVIFEKLAQIGITADDVRRLTVPFSTAANPVPSSPAKKSCGRRGLPPELISTMWADYQRLGNLRDTAKLHGRTAPTLSAVFTSRGLQCFKPGHRPKTGENS